MSDKRVSMIVDEQTGEVVDEMHPGDRILRKESLDYLANYQEWHLENFYKGHTAELKKLLPELDAYERAFLFTIAAYVGYDDCCLKYPDGEDITSEDLVALSGFGRRKVFETINSLIKKDILYKGKNSKNRQYFINPWLFCRGNRINKVLKTMFKNYKIRVLGGTKWKNLK